MVEHPKQRISERMRETKFVPVREMTLFRTADNPRQSPRCAKKIASVESLGTLKNLSLAMTWFYNYKKNQCDCTDFLLYRFYYLSACLDKQTYQFIQCRILSLVALALFFKCKNLFFVFLNCVLTFFC